MKKLLIASFLILSACGKFEVPKDPRTIHGVNDEFIPYINLYLQAKGLPMFYDIPMQFADLKGDIVGTCWRWHAPDFREIKIDESYWRLATRETRISLVFHELAHCDLNREHDETFLSNGWPRSFMFPINLGYPPNMELYYFAELFNPATAVTYNKALAHDETCVHDIE